MTADGDWSHDIKRCLLLERKVMTNLDSILKNRDYFVHKGPSSKALVFPVVMNGCESWTIKKAKHRRIDAFELWCWRRLLRVSWTARRSNQSILKEISPGCSLEGLMLKLKLQYFGHVIPVSERSLGGGHGNPLQYSCLENPMGRAVFWDRVHRVTKSWTWLSDWTKLDWGLPYLFFQGASIF